MKIRLLRLSTWSVSLRVFAILLLAQAPLCAQSSSESPSSLEPVESAARFLPPSTVVYAEVPDPATVLSLVLDHPLREKIEGLEPYQAATNSEAYKRFLLGRTVVEAQVQMPWRQAIETFLARGVAVGVDLETKGVALIVRGRDNESMELLREKLLEFAKLSPNPDRIKEAVYRGITVHQVDKFAMALHGSWMLLTNQKDLGKKIVDQMLDGGESLAEQSRFIAATEGRDEHSLAWAYVDVESLREAGVARHVFFDQINQPLGELIFGGIQSSLKETPYATASLQGNAEKLELEVGMPHQSDWLPEFREYYFGPDGTGRARTLPPMPETLFAMSTYRDFSEMWLRAGDLFNADVNDGLAKADANLTTLFAGRDFGEDILGSFQPQVEFIAVRQEFDNSSPVPTIKLPAFAAIFELREPESMTRELRRTFQSLIGFLNVVGSMNGQHQLELDMEPIASGGELVSATYVPEDDEQESNEAEIVFNFSPSVAFVGDRCVIASSRRLAKALAEFDDVTSVETDDNTQARLDAKVLRDVLTDNRSQLVAQNMLEEGHTREEAEASIDLLLEVMGYFQGASASLGVVDDRLRFQLSLEVIP